MRYFELEGSLNTYFKKEGIDNDLSGMQLDEKIKEASEYFNGSKERSRKILFRDDNLLLSIMKDQFNRDNDENLALSIVSFDKRYFKICIQTSKDEKIITNICDKLNEIIKSNINNILIEKDDEIEVYVKTDYRYNEISFLKFYFDDLLKSEDFGIDLNKYYRSTNNYYLSSGNEFRYGRINEYIYEFDLDSSLDEQSFREKYKMILVNDDIKDEIDRIFNSKNEHKVNINPVHYQFSSNLEKDRIEEAKAIAEALFIQGRIKKPKLFKINIDLSDSALDNQIIQLALENSKDCFVFLDFDYRRTRTRSYISKIHTSYEIDLEEIKDSVMAMKDDVQFGFYIDKYNEYLIKKVEDSFVALNIVKFGDKINPSEALSYVNEIATKYNVEIDDKLEKMVNMSKYSLTKKEAVDIFDNYKSELIKNKYFPSYKKFFDGLGNNDKYIDPYEELQSLIGLKNVKKTIDEILTFIKMDRYKKEYLIEYKSKDKILNSRYNGNALNMNMLFMGNPGTAKTTVANMMGKILKSRGVIKSDKVVELTGMNIYDAFNQAFGGILFIDEAYKLQSFFGTTTILVELMEKYRNDTVVILAGYTDLMKQFLHSNQGLKSRFKYLIEFEDYNEEELWEILKYQADKENLVVEDSVKEKLFPIFSSAQCDKELGNGRLVRNILDYAILKQAKRYKDVDLEKEEIDKNELFKLKSDDFDIDLKRITGYEQEKIIGNIDPEIEFNNMIGLSEVKKVLEKYVASAEINKLRKENNDKLIRSPMHLAFTGNPGTAKTTVARLLARLLKKKNIIKKDRILEVGRSDLVGKYVGHTAPLVKSQFEKAKGGVLFIDEAYSLLDGREGLYGDEAINTIIAEMENHRDDVIVIFAGYKDRMKDFIDRNEGLRSRLSYIIDFEDYKVDELYEIFEKMIKDNNLKIDGNVKSIVIEKFNEVVNTKDYGNGRYVRKLIEEAKLNMDLRLCKLKEVELKGDILWTLTADDFQDISNENNIKKNDFVVGFQVA